MTPDAPVALVTGTKRIGAAVGVALAERGFDVALGCHTSAEAADRAASRIRAMGRRALTLTADLASPPACRDLVARTVDACGRLDALVLLASQFVRTAFDDLDVDTWNAALAVDLSASFHCARAAVPHLRATRGRIVLFSDWVAASGRPRYRGFLPYYVAKRSVIALGEALALELAADGILVHTVAPGPIVPVAGSTAAEQQAVIDATPLGRWGGEDEVARIVLALVDAMFVTGETVRVDGGRHLR
jgi:NAD(P)-dependent dehydrogenase (short-subunit alcohol dehydrogenase family)